MHCFVASSDPSPLTLVFSGSAVYPLGEILDRRGRPDGVRSLFWAALVAITVLAILAFAPPSRTAPAAEIQAVAWLNAWDGSPDTSSHAVSEVAASRLGQASDDLLATDGARAPGPLEARYGYDSGYDSPAVARAHARGVLPVGRAVSQLLSGEEGISAPVVATGRAATTPSVLTYTPRGLGAGLQFADDGARGFGSMSSFRRAYGSAGPGNQWHHVVEQTPGNVGRFGAQSIHNTSNIVRLETGVHRQISGYYSSIQPFTGGQTVRQWLSTQPLEAQRQFGLDVLQRFGAAG